MAACPMVPGNTATAITITAALPDPGAAPGVIAATRRITAGCPTVRGSNPPERRRPLWVDSGRRSDPDQLRNSLLIITAGYVRLTNPVVSPPRVSSSGRTRD